MSEIRIHDLRHQYASFLVNCVRTLYEVQQIHGHSDSMVTQRYAHPCIELRQDTASSASVIIGKRMRPGDLGGRRGKAPGRGKSAHPGA